ncbi:MAG: hypothetical protein ACJ8AB_01195 [Gemmatimonadaceae bacterium]
MEKKDRSSGNPLLRYVGSVFALLAAAAVVGCGSDDDSTGPARVHYPSSITASATGCGLAEVVVGKDTTHVQSFNATATWQASGTWKAIFVNASTGKVLATTAADASQTKTSVTVAAGKSTACAYHLGDIAYAILFPDGDSPVASDADLTPTLTVGP